MGLLAKLTEAVNCLPRKVLIHSTTHPFRGILSPLEPGTPPHTSSQAQRRHPRAGQRSAVPLQVVPPKSRHPWCWNRLALLRASLGLTSPSLFRTKLQCRPGCRGGVGKMGGHPSTSSSAICGSRPLVSMKCYRQTPSGQGTELYPIRSPATGRCTGPILRYILSFTCRTRAAGLLCANMRQRTTMSDPCRTAH